ncbi:MAG TPA: excinuclease ABC subunit UvrB [Candidatus Wallbacteria bacterium]|nr:excinuclease ABC subunit UvrB [Candidatus Wallbacteria bacterium]
MYLRIDNNKKNKPFKLNSKYSPTGDQPQAIEKILSGFDEDRKHITLMGVTGSGKTFTMANVIEKLQVPTLIITHNKTLSAQLYAEFKDFFPDNAVEYFVSYYDYYQPEAYIPHTDTYIEKDSDINEKIDKLRHSATHALLTRSDVIIVASVSCIYGLGSPDIYESMKVLIQKDHDYDIDSILKRLVEMQYTRTTMDLSRSMFRMRGDILEIVQSFGEDVIRISFFGDIAEKISVVNQVSGEIISELDDIAIFPATHFVAPEAVRTRALADIDKELTERLFELKKEEKLVEMQRLSQRTMYDMEMIKEIGYCKGIENYSRILSGRAPGTPPETLIDYFPKDYLLIIDESHITVPQISGMEHGDFSRKKNLVEFGFRIPCAYDNRPLKFKEFEQCVNRVLYVSATPSVYEIDKSRRYIAEQIIRPTGLLDPEITVRSTSGQIDDLISEIKKRAEKKERVLVTTLTKRMAEDLTTFLQNAGILAQYLHSEVVTLERTEIIRNLRLGKFDALIGINLLREGLDIPEVSLVAILDADREGFLRSHRSLIQTCGRAARNVNGTVIFYADKITDSMKKTIDETNRRRKIQVEYNEKHNITPRTIIKNIFESMVPQEVAEAAGIIGEMTPEKLSAAIAELEKKMYDAAYNLNFEEASGYRDQILALGGKLDSDESKGKFSRTRVKGKR